jgi:hypothetical protein
MFRSPTSAWQRILQVFSLTCKLFAVIAVCALFLGDFSIPAADAAGGKQGYSSHRGGKSFHQRSGFRKKPRSSYRVGTYPLGYWGGPRRFGNSYYGGFSRNYSGHRGFGHGNHRYGRHRGKGGNWYAWGGRGRGYRGGYYDAYYNVPLEPFYANNIRRYHGGRYNHADRGYNGGYARNISSGALIISLGSGGSEQMDNPAASGVAPEIEGDCDAGGYCTVRLGPYLNSPKIITLNTRYQDSGPR